MTDTSLSSGGTVIEQPVSATRTLLGQVRYANRGFWRTPVAAFFTLLFPLSFLVILSALYGNEVVDPDTGLRLAQYTTPVFAVFGACMATYVSLGSALAHARHSGVLKRLRGTPLTPPMHIAGRVLSAIWLAALAVVLMISAGVGLYGVQIVWANVPALVLTFVVGTGCFAALGIALAAVAPTPNAATTFGNASLILLSFISGVFGFGELPDWMDRLASVFPLEPFVESFSDGFNPYVEASSPDWANLGVILAWGVVGAVLAGRAMGVDPDTRRRRAPAEPAADLGLAGQGGAGQGTEPTAARSPAVVTGSAPGPSALARQQTRYATLQIIRDPMSLFFAVAFPVILVVFFSSVYGDEAQWGGLPLPQYLAAALAVYAVATSAFLNLAGSIADTRAPGVLKRLRGTPLPTWAYLAGRVVCALLIGLTTVVAIFVICVLFFAVTLPPATWAPTLLTFTLAIACFAACGLALVALVDGPQAVTAVGLSLLLPLSFISDIFVAVESMPTVLNAVGWFFPLRHAVAGAVAATSGGQLDATFWTHLLVLGLWMVAMALVARRWFHWEPRGGRGGRHRHPREGTELARVTTTAG
ncbi:MAG: ABC transporter permease [Candidatus Nanopelagicales bacterium]